MHINLPDIFSSRLLFSIALSVSAHVLLLASLAGSFAPKGEAVPHVLAVRLVGVPAVPPAPQKKPQERTVLSQRNAAYRLQEVSKPIQPVPVVVAMPDEIAKTANSGELAIKEVEQGAPSGFALPRAIGLPWLPRNVQVRPEQRHEKPVEAYREMHEAALAEDRNQIAAAQKMKALSANLAERLRDVSGRCTVFRSAETTGVAFRCEPAELEKALRERALAIVESLFGSGGDLNAYEITIAQNKARITQVPKPIK
jgi:hypothetical protein